MIGGYPIGSAPIASQPVFGAHHPGVAFCEDGTVMFVYGSDVADENIVFGGATSGLGSVHGGDSGVPGGGYAYGGDSETGKVKGGDERAG